MNRIVRSETRFYDCAHSKLTSLLDTSVAGTVGLLVTWLSQKPCPLTASPWRDWKEQLSWLSCFQLATTHSSGHGDRTWAPQEVLEELTFMKLDKSHCCHAFHVPASTMRRHVNPQQPLPSCDLQAPTHERSSLMSSQTCWPWNH